MAYAIEVRRFIFLVLLTLPFVLFNEVPKVRAVWLTPIVEMLVAYAFLALDKIGHELQQPFVTYRLNQLPLDELSALMEANALAIFAEPVARAGRPSAGELT